MPGPLMLSRSSSAMAMAISTHTSSTAGAGAGAATPSSASQPILADLRSQTTNYFPSFPQLPSENDVSPNYYRSIDKIYVQPKHHWLFLAEITDVQFLFRLCLIARDKEGRNVRIYFHTEMRGMEFATTLLAVGHTVAILYAHSKIFMDGSIGVRVDEVGSVKIIPTSLYDLLRLNDIVHASTKTYVEDRQTRVLMACYGCHGQRDFLKKCSKCELVRYCDKHCQAIGWNERNHKTDCKILRDPDVKAMFTMRWDDFQGSCHFPLAKGGEQTEYEQRSEDIELID